MSSRPRKPSNTNPRATASRSWRALLIRRKGQLLGDVEAPSREAAEAEAADVQYHARAAHAGAGLRFTMCELVHTDVLPLLVASPYTRDGRIPARKLMQQHKPERLRKRLLRIVGNLALWLVLVVATIGVGILASHFLVPLSAGE